MPHLDMWADVADLAEALDELDRRERTGEPNYPLCCLILGRPEATVSINLRELVLEAWSYLDELTGDDLLVLVPAHSGGPRGQDPDTVDRLELATVKYLDVNRDALPAIVFFVPGNGCSERLVLKLDDYIPDDSYRDNERCAYDLLSKTMHVITEAARRSARHLPDERLAVLRQELIDRRPRTRSNPTPEPPARIAALRANTDTAASVVSALAAVITLVIGGNPPG